ncbi:hypothetical protein [Paucilactobacillus hokkaidonensis]|uniref:hypothetical protein n=1 Tax=Paucilactobacillus hokkaidonensis TaxID=1193095 RepID=UPI0020938022|nr:hypothetical protein [Paucilactobacillus hokkaidonensis]
MEKEKKNFSAKQFVGEIKDRLKGRYAQTLGALLGISVISIAVLAGAAIYVFGYSGC